MNWKTETSGFLSVTHNLGGGIWRKVPAILQVYDGYGTAWSTTVSVYIGGVSAGGYLLNSDKRVVIDISERLATLTGNVIIEVSGEDNDVTITASIKGGDVSPELLLPPPTALCVNSNGTYVVPPPSSVTAIASGGTLSAYMAAFSSASGLKIGTTSVSANTPSVVSLSGTSVVSTFNGEIHTTRLNEPRCGKQYAAIRWVPPFGSYCLHAVEIRDIERSTVDSTELQHVVNEFRMVSGYEISGTMHFENLTAYDYWYYSLICQSQDVRIGLGQAVTLTAPDEYQQVKITTKSVTQPNGLGRQSLDIDFTALQFAAY